MSDASSTLQFTTTATDSGAGAAFDDLVGKLDSLVDALGRTGGPAADGAVTNLSRVGDVAGITNVAVGSLVADGLLKLGGALVGVAGDSINVAAEFEAGMLRLSSVAGSAITDAGLTLDDFQNKFLELGAVTQFSAAQAQDAAIALAKGGVAIPDIMAGATQATLDLAAAGELELAPAADIVAKQLGVWGETGVTAAQVADSLASAANASTVDVSELALGLANVGGSAKVAGVDFGDLVQTMALIAPGFSSAADAGTSLKTMISSLIPKSDEASNAMTELGLIQLDLAAASAMFGQDFAAMGDPIASVGEAISMQAHQMTTAKAGTEAYTKEWAKHVASLKSSLSSNVFFDAQGAFIGMEQAAGLLKDATKDLSEEQKLQAFNTIFGSDAIRAAAAIANAGAEGFTQMGAAMANAGSAADQAAQRNKGFGFAVDSLKGTLETLQIVVGMALLPVLTTLIEDVVTPGANAVLAFAQSATAAGGPLERLSAQAEVLIGAWGDHAVPVLASVGSALASVGSKALNLGESALAVLHRAWVAVAPPLDTANRGLEQLQTIFTSLPGVIDGSMGKTVAFMGAVSGLLGGGAVGLEVAKFAATLTNTLGTAFDHVGNLAGRVFPILQYGIGVLDGSSTSALFLGRALQASSLDVQGAWTAFGSAADLISTGLAQARDYLSGWIAESLPGWLSGVQQFAAPLGQWALDAVPVLIGGLVDARVRMFDWVTESLPGWLSSVQQFAAPLGQWALDAVPVLLGAIGTLFQAQIDQVFTYVPLWAAALVPFGIAAVSWAADQLPALANNLGQFANAMITWVVDSVPGWATNLAAFGAQAIGWVLDALPGLGTNLGLMSGNIFGWVVQTGIDVIPKLAGLAVQFVAWIGTTVIPALPGALLTIGEAVYNFIDAAATQVEPKLADLGTRFYTWVGTTVIPALPGALELIKTTIGGWMSGAVGWVALEAASIGSNIIDGIISGVQGGVGALLDAVQGAATDALNSAKEALGIHSPSRVFASEVGAPIVEGIVKGILDHADDVGAALEHLFDAGSVIGNLGSTVAGQIKEQQLTPLKDSLDGITSEVDRVTREIVDINTLIGVNPDNDAALQQRLLNLEAQRTALLGKQTDARKAYEATAQRIAAFEQQQANLQFLQQQVKLLDLISEHGLDAAQVLNGLQLGVNADPDALLAAMTRALEGIVGQVGVQAGIPIDGARATGGPVSFGNTYLIGENGPELFTPGASGAITSTADTMRLLSGGDDQRDNRSSGAGGGLTITIHIDARGAMDPRAVEEAGYRGAQRALREAGMRGDVNQRMRGR